MRSVLLILALMACSGDGPTDTPQTCGLVFDEDSIGWDAVALDDALSQAVQLLNTCEQDVTIGEADIDGDGVFSVEPTQILDSLIEPGERLAIEVSYTPAGDYGPHAAVLRVSSERGSTTIALGGAPSGDQDGDGVLAQAVGGTDCDDQNAAIGAPTDEVDNGLDDDCDGVADEGFIEPGDVRITELMLRPDAVRQEVGQWVELQNMRDQPIDLIGWTLEGPAGVLTIEGSVVVQPGAHAVVGVEPDLLQNGGIPYDGVLVGPGTPLQIRDWELTAALNQQVIAALQEGEWDDPFGASIQLDPTIDDPSAAEAPALWCVSTMPLENGDFGTPGADNAWCSHIDHDEDGVSVDDGDCDDTDPLISPGLPERWNGEDDDCDTITDELNPRFTGIGKLYGSASYERMGLLNAFAVTDWDGDGTATLAISRGNFGSRVVSFVDTSVLIGADNPITDLQQGTIIGGGVLNPTWIPRHQVDMDGDGDLDVTLIGSQRPALLWLIDAPPTGGAELTSDDVQLSVGGSGTSSREDSRALLHLDLNGDTFLDTVLSNPSQDSDPRGFSQDGWIRVLDLNDVEGEVLSEDVRVRAWQGAEDTGTGITLAGDDLNGNGYDDLLFRTGDPRGAYGSTDVLWIAGGATLPESGATTDAAIATFTGLGSLGAGSSGADMLIEDFDADGSLDLLIGDPSAQAAHLFFDVGTQSGSIDVASADVTLTGISRFGVSLMWADVDGDGEADLSISDGELASRDYSRVFIYDADTLLSGSTVDVNQAKAFMQGPSETDAFGQWMWSGDLDNDPTRAELLIGSPGVDPTGAGFDQKGMIWVLPGGAL